MGNWWAEKLGGIAAPQPQAPAPPAQQQGAWWQPQQPAYNPALAAQMPGQYPQTTTSDGHVVNDQLIEQLKRVPADQLNGEQMELIAQHELDNMRKYNQACPQCGSANFVPAGTVLGNKRMGSDKCFECGASSSTYTSSPEPARGGGKTSSKVPYRDVRQIDAGGGAGSMYLALNGLPPGYVPRG